MFGYVVINEQELKVREVGVYRSYYCGLCRMLREQYGISGQMTLTYDMTFLILLLSDLYDAGDELGETRCIAHPFEKHATRCNEFTEYAADMNILLSYYSCLDDWSDEHKMHKLLASKLLKKKCTRAGADYGHKAAVIKDRLDRLHASEAEKETDIDKVAGYFGDIMSELFAVREDDWEVPLRQMGFYLGKFVYLMDAYDDLEKDMKSGSYNPVAVRFSLSGGLDDEMRARLVTTLLHSRNLAGNAFELLETSVWSGVIRNIIFLGMPAVCSAVLSGAWRKSRHGAPK